jgi:hypothetical protein
VTLKYESRVAVGWKCSENIYIIAILRGKERIEYIFVSNNPKDAIMQLKGSTFIHEVRAAWPSGLAEELSLKHAKLEAYLSECSNCVADFFKHLCREVSRMFNSKIDKGQ